MTDISSNDLGLWAETLPRPEPGSHKYDRGHALIFGAPSLIGATRLAAAACSRIGAGLVSVVPGNRADIYRASLPADIMVNEMPKDVKNPTAMLGGSGGIIASHRKMLLERDGMPRVFDAMAIPGQNWLSALDENCILTPHEGEFITIFGGFDNKHAAVKRVAAYTGAIVVLKGAYTLIAHPSGAIVSHDRPNPYLAKAGTGDVLSGMIVGLAAQGMPPFEAACSAVWMHSEAGARIGPGLVAQDIELYLPKILQEILNEIS